MEQTPIQLIVGLGNPGQQYTNTRHNAGADFVYDFANRHDGTFKEAAKFKSLYTKIQIGARDCHLAIPLTYMNHSGQAVQAIAAFYKIPVKAILVVHDELDLPAGVVRLKQGGGHGGHNGIRDIITLLGERDFLRLRIGISHPGQNRNVVDYVLKRPSKEDADNIATAEIKALEIMNDLLKGNIQNAIQILHTKPEEAASVK
jgi:peptidyl-tRNA hydrolase, PTH1 family